jgi:hypothetical protein
MFKMAFQQGRNEQRGKSCSVPYVEPLSDVRTKLEDFFNILQVIVTGESSTCYRGTLRNKSSVSDRQEANLCIDFHPPTMRSFSHTQGITPMPFVIRPYRRFPVFCPVKYEVRVHAGYGTVMNFSPRGWRVHGNLPLQPGEVSSLKVQLPTHKRVSVAAGIVRWVQGEEFGIETLVMSAESQEVLHEYLAERLKAL